VKEGGGGEGVGNLENTVYLGREHKKAWTPQVLFVQSVLVQRCNSASAGLNYLEVSKFVLSFG
jgi:hypothetical protein